MDVQNFRLLQNFKFKEQKLEEKLNKQKSILQQLRMEYESLKKDDEVKTTPADKFKQKKNLRSIYTFKLPVSKHQNKNDVETSERFRYGWLQRPLTELPRKIQDLNIQRSRMIELGNSYSENNKKCPLAAKTIRRTKTQHEMKYEMLNRAKLLGNHYSFRFRQHHPLKVYKKSIDSYKMHERLINQKNEMEELFKSGEELPQIFPQKYLHVLNEIYRLEVELNLNHQFTDDEIGQKILNFDTSNDQKLIDRLSHPIFDDLDVVSDEIEMTRAMERIDIGKILEATNVVEQRKSKEFWSRDDAGVETAKELNLKTLTHNDTDLIDSKSMEAGFECADIDVVNQDKDATNSMEHTTDSQDIVIENEELVYISEKFQSKSKENDYLDRTSHEFFTFKNLLLEISDKASRKANQNYHIPSSTSLSNLKGHPSQNQALTDNSHDTAITYSPIFSQELDSKLAQTLKVFCENYIEDLCDVHNIPKHHPSFEDIQIKFIHETTSNVDAGPESDDSQEIYQVSHEICKSQASILRTKNVESSKLLKITNAAVLNENYVTSSIQKDKTSDDYKTYNYSSEIALSSIENPQSAVTMLYK